MNGKQGPKARPRKIGLALSGGGLRGLSHIGVLKALQDNAIPIDFIAGTSAGSIIAALHSCGYRPDEMQSTAKSLSVSDLIKVKIPFSAMIKQGKKWLFGRKHRVLPPFPSGIIQGDRIEKYFSRFWLNRTVRDTAIPIALTAVDLYSADTVFFLTPHPGMREILNARYYYNTSLSEAVRASISIPGVFTPVKYRGMMLVDGAVKNNLPTDILRHMGAERIIAIDLGYAGQPDYEIQNVSDILLRCIEIMNREVTLLKGEEYADILIRPQAYIGLSPSAEQIDKCIKSGEEAVLAKIGEIRSLLTK
ncbi:patatin [Anaerosporomusa subterranea]|uniref:Patatin n=1 Tax=Anaerosporomusa subterranea TaxID=1794912 RepID=A0A154BTH2_ANASB|nr:patatin-like phospholipase family protein [Anaerosporomusa subterranea]KYZ77175.1 patatin [Anaerosporomusa subterranea]